MAQSQITRKYFNLSILFGCLSFLVLTAPIIYYAVLAFINGETTEKFTLGITFVMAAIFLAINVIFKYHIRSTIWVVVLGIYCCLDNIQMLLIMVAVGTILDEFIFSPLHKSYKQKAGINREIDKRIE